MKYRIRNLDCANCAQKVEDHLKRVPGIHDVSLSFATLTLAVDTDDIGLLQREIAQVEPGIEVTPLTANDKAGEEFHPRRELILIGLALVFFLCQLLFGERLHQAGYPALEYALSFSAYLLAGANVLLRAYRSVRRGRFFDEHILMTIASVGAIAIHALSEAVGVMVFFKVGEFLQSLAVARSRRSIRALLEIKPDFAHLRTDIGYERVAPEQVNPGDLIVVKPGEKVPLDGVVVEGDTRVNAAALTGESVPVARRPEDEVLAGEINLTCAVLVRVTRRFADSSAARILDLVENAAARKARTEQIITRFARWYTPAVVIAAALIAVLPPLLVPGQAFATWLYRALVLLVISCPCALVVSIPLGYFGGIGGASRQGILVKGANFLDALAGVKTVVFDKTGTLTRGVFRVRQIVPHHGWSESELLNFAALAESHSTHPIAASITSAATERGIAVSPVPVIEHRDVAGQGVVARTREHVLAVGNEGLMRGEIANGQVPMTNEETGTVVHVAVDGVYAGYIMIGDEVKHNAPEAMAALRRAGVRRLVMLTGDQESAARAIAEQLGLDEFHAGLRPADKVREFDRISAAGQGGIAFVGDGINDAPVLARADVGIAMGALGSEAAIESADVVLMTDQLTRVAQAINIGRRTRAIVWQNIIFALGIKVVFLILGAGGLAGMWEAVFADMGTTLLAVLNSARALHVPGPAGPVDWPMHRK